MNEDDKKALQQRAIRAYNDSREAAALGLPDVAQRHWETCVRLCLEEKGEAVPPSLEPGLEAPKP